MSPRGSQGAEPNTKTFDRSQETQKKKILNKLEEMDNFKNKIRQAGSVIWEEKERIMERLRMEKEKWQERNEELRREERERIMAWKRLSLDNERLR